MILRKMATCVFLLISLLCFGCGKSAPAPASVPQAAATPPAMDSVARIHWLGKKRVSADTNAADLMRVWSLPESIKFQNQILDKFSASPWRFLRNETNPASTNLLHPLLQDLIDTESYLEVDQPAGSTNQPGEIVLAVRLSDERAGLWQTNIAAALKSLTGISLTNASAGRWVLKKHHVPNTIELARVGEWTVLGAAQDQNTLLDQTIAQLRAGKPLVRDQATNSLLEASLDFPRLSSAIGTNYSWLANFPAVSFVVTASGHKLWTTGELHLQDFAGTVLPPWNIPTNLIQSDFTSFTAIRGVAPFLRRSAMLNALNIGLPPDQFFVWALTGIPMETYFAIPYPGASNAVSHFADSVLEKGRPWFATNDLARFKRATNYNGLQWKGLPYLAPFVQSISAAGSEFIFGGTFAPDTNYPSSANLFKQLYGDTNLVYYDFEHTGERINQLIFIGQFGRVVTGRPQLASTSPGLPWLQALASILGDSLTTCETTAVPGQVKFVRSSTIGMTALELNLFVQELESFESANGNPKQN